jgi:hypothetical protein
LWPYLLALTAVPALVSAVVLPFFPESPRYLLINKNDEQAARKGEQHSLTHAHVTSSEQKTTTEWIAAYLLGGRRLYKVY